jgi:hypothetical protein
MLTHHISVEAILLSHLTYVLPQAFVIPLWS